MTLERETLRLLKDVGGSENEARTEERRRQITAELTHLVYAQMPASLTITILNATLLVFVFRHVIEPRPLLAWWTTIGSIALLRLTLLYRYRRAASAARETSRWQTFFTFGAIAAGCGWGAAGIFLFPPASLAHQVFLTFTLGGMAIGAVASLAAIKRAYVGFILPTTLPLIIRFFSQGGELFIVMGVLSSIFLVGILVMAAQFHTAIAESLTFRFERQDLLQSQETLQQSNEELERRVQARTARTR